MFMLVHASLRSQSQRLRVLTCSLLALLPLAAMADPLRDAERLLRVADAGSKFEHRARLQAESIIHNYTVIISRNTDYHLPAPVQQQIAACYSQVYRWENFAAGIARILADNLSREELRLLIDFHRNLGLPPNKIELFRNTVAKVGLIHEQSADYIFARSPGCVDQDAELILRHLREQDIVWRPL